MRRVRARGDEAVELLLDRQHLSRLSPSSARPGLSFSNATMGPSSLGGAAFDMVGDLRGRGPGVIGVGRARAGRLS